MIKSNRNLEIEGHAYAYRKFNKAYAPKIVEKRPSFLIRVIRHIVSMFGVKHERTA